VNGRFNRSAFDTAKRCNPMPVNVRPAIPEDIPHIIEIERLSPTAAHWSEEQYRRAIHGVGDLSLRVVLVAELDDPVREEVNNPALLPLETRRQGLGVLTAFLVARHADTEWELENIVVGSEFRGRGIGTQLIEALLERMRATNASAVFLEVRESNIAARKLYQKAGFRETGRRKLYYSDPAEDAILYRREA
jgi:[ribosomal protein S18]-alanine N-acetyltransferase